MPIKDVILTKKAERHIEKHTEVSVSEEEVKIPLPEELYEKIKGKRVVIVPKG